MPPGQPTKYNAKLATRIVALYRKGKTDLQVSKIIGVSVSTINNWRVAYPEFLETIREAKQEVNDMVRGTLLQKALGFERKEEKVQYSYGWQKIKWNKYHPPDTTAIIHWLRNREPGEWGNSGLAPQLPENCQKIARKLTFEEFCIKAGYPAPFAKQVEMMQFGMSTDDPRLLLGSRGYGKTDYVTILGVAYDIYLNENSTNLIISKSKVRNTSMMQEIARALVCNGVELEKENSNCVRRKGLIAKDDSAEVLTIKSSFRGRHHKRVIMDDPVTEEDTSEAMRLLVKKKYDEAYKLCKNILIIGQPSHRHDLYADLRPVLKKMEVPHGTIPELDADLIAMKLAGIDPASIEMSYHLRVPNEGTTPFDKVKYIDGMIPGETVAFIDPSFEGGDYTALTILRAYMDGVAVVGFVWKKSWNNCVEDIGARLTQFNVKRLCFETNSLGEMPVVLLRKAYPSVGITGRKSNGNKHSRIMAAGAFAPVIHLSRQSDKVYLDQVVKYEYKSKYDDAPDSLASGLEWLGLVRGKI